MKRAIILIASLLLVVSLAGIASAEMVNIGLVAIDQSDDNDIRDRVAGIKAAPATAVAPRPAPINIGLVEIDAADLDALQDYVSGRKGVEVRSGKNPRADRVDLGIVEMSRTDLQDLEKLTSWMKNKNHDQLSQGIPVALAK